MSELNENTISLLKNTSVTMSTNAATILYTVPTGKTCIVAFVIVHSASGTLAGCDDVNFGGNSSDYNDFDDAQDDLDLITTTTKCMVLFNTRPEDATYQVGVSYAAGTEFKINIINGADAAATATVSVFGFLF